MHRLDETWLFSEQTTSIFCYFEVNYWPNVKKAGVSMSFGQKFDEKIQNC